jgi:hypothetical protein
MENLTTTQKAQNAIDHFESQKIASNIKRQKDISPHNVKIQKYQQDIEKYTLEMNEKISTQKLKIAQVEKEYSDAMEYYSLMIKRQIEKMDKKEASEVLKNKNPFDD